MEDEEREIVELKLAVAKLEAQNGRARWWNVAAGIASIVGAALGSLTLWGILNLLAQR